MTIFYIIRQRSEVYTLSAVFLQEINTTLLHCSPRQFWMQSISGDLSLPTESSSSLCHSFHTLIWLSNFTFWHPFFMLQRLVLLNCLSPLQAPAYFTPLHLCDFFQMFSLPGMPFPSACSYLSFNIITPVSPENLRWISHCSYRLSCILAYSPMHTSGLTPC